MGRGKRKEKSGRLVTDDEIDLGQVLFQMYCMAKISNIFRPPQKEPSKHLTLYQGSQGRRKHLKLGGHDTSRALFPYEKGDIF